MIYIYIWGIWGSYYNIPKAPKCCHTSYCSARVVYVCFSDWRTSGSAFTILLWDIQSFVLLLGPTTAQHVTSEALLTIFLHYPSKEVIPPPYLKYLFPCPIVSLCPYAIPEWGSLPRDYSGGALGYVFRKVMLGADYKRGSY